MKEKLYFDVLVMVYRSNYLNGYTKQQFFNFIRPVFKNFSNNKKRELEEYILQRLIKEKVFYYPKDLHGAKLFDSYWVNEEIIKMLIRKQKLKRVIND